MTDIIELLKRCVVSHPDPDDLAELMAQEYEAAEAVNTMSETDSWFARYLELAWIAEHLKAELGGV